MSCFATRLHLPALSLFIAFLIFVAHAHGHNDLEDRRQYVEEVGALIKGLRSQMVGRLKELDDEKSEGEVRSHRIVMASSKEKDAVSALPRNSSARKKKMPQVISTKEGVDHDRLREKIDFLNLLTQFQESLLVTDGEQFVTNAQSFRVYLNLWIYKSQPTLRKVENGYEFYKIQGLHEPLKKIDTIMAHVTSDERTEPLLKLFRVLLGDVIEFSLPPNMPKELMQTVNDRAKSIGLRIQIEFPFLVKEFVKYPSVSDDFAQWATRLKDSPSGDVSNFPDELFTFWHILYTFRRDKNALVPWEQLHCKYMDMLGRHKVDVSRMPSIIAIVHASHARILLAEHAFSKAYLNEIMSIEISQFQDAEELIRKTNIFTKAYAELVAVFHEATKQYREILGITGEEETKPAASAIAGLEPPVCLPSNAAGAAKKKSKKMKQVSSKTKAAAAIRAAQAAKTVSPEADDDHAAGAGAAPEENATQPAPAWMRSLKEDNQVDYQKFLGQLRNSFGRNGYKFEKNGDNGDYVTFVSPVNGKNTHIFMHTPHGAQLKKAWPAWRYTLLDQLQEAGYVF